MKSFGSSLSRLFPKLKFLDVLEIPLIEIKEEFYLQLANKVNMKSINNSANLVKRKIVNSVNFEKCSGPCLRIRKRIHMKMKCILNALKF